MEEGKYEKRYWIGTVINSILTVAALIGLVFQLMQQPKAIPMYIVLVEILLVFYYVVAGYKKPHGNLLRYLIWGVVLYFMFELNVSIQNSNVPIAIISTVLIAFVSYVSGRLNKLKQNQVLFIIILLITLAVGILKTAGFGMGVPPEMIDRMPTAMMPGEMEPIPAPVNGPMPEGPGSGLVSIFHFVPFILWIDITFAYMVRYMMHKEAGF